MTRAALALAFLLSACADVRYEDAPVGTFQGSLFVMWVGEGNGGMGDGQFLFVPNPRNPLTFTSSKDDLKISPEMFYTDGGTIPKFAQVFRGFSPWGCAPAYMVHDWLFVAHHCNEDGLATPKQAMLKDVTFERSAELIGESIKTLVHTGRVRKNDVAPAVITSTVSGPISWHLWNRKGACRSHDVTKEDQDRAYEAIFAKEAGMRASFDKDAAWIVGEVDF